MPPVSRRLPLARRGWTVGHVYFALKGSWFFRGDHIDLADVQALWRAYGASLLALWVTHHPGARPWGWWQWDAPEPVGEDADGEPEDQAAYLTRHRRWLPGEKARWQAGAVHPWTLDDVRRWLAGVNGV
jgi:hypothetical protein